MKELPNLDIESKIDNFMEMTLPNNASQIQINEIRKAFIAGMCQSKCDIMYISTFEENSANDFLSTYVKNLNKIIDKYINKEIKWNHKTKTSQ